MFLWLSAALSRILNLFLLVHTNIQTVDYCWPTTFFLKAPNFRNPTKPTSLQSIQTCAFITRYSEVKKGTSNLNIHRWMGRGLERPYMHLGTPYLLLDGRMDPHIHSIPYHHSTYSTRCWSHCSLGFSGNKSGPTTCLKMVFQPYSPWSVHLSFRSEIHNSDHHFLGKPSPSLSDLVKFLIDSLNH